MDDVTQVIRKFGWSRKKAIEHLGLVAEAEARLDCPHGLPRGCCAVCFAERKQGEIELLGDEQV